jgi:hypothetical protein
MLKRLVYSIVVEKCQLQLLEEYGVKVSTNQYCQRYNIYYLVTTHTKTLFDILVPLSHLNG